MTFTFWGQQCHLKKTHLSTGMGTVYEWARRVEGGLGIKGTRQAGPEALTACQK